MDDDKRKKLEAAGYAVGDAAEFLGMDHIRWARLVDDKGIAHDRCDYRWGDELKLRTARSAFFTWIEFLDERELMVYRMALAAVSPGDHVNLSEPSVTLSEP